MRKHLLFIVGSLGYGGAEKHVIALLNGLSLEEFRLSLVCVNRPAPLLDQLDEGRLERIVFGNSDGKIDFELVRKISEYIDSSHVDLIVSTNQYPMIYAMASRIASRRSPKLFEVFHTTILSSWKERILMILYRILFWLQDCVVYVCESQRIYWRKRWLFSRRDAVIHNGVNVDWFRDVWGADEKNELRKALSFSAQTYVIGICAALRPEKCHGDAVQAVMKLRARGVDAALLIIGDGIERNNIEEMSAKLGIDRWVKITGYQGDVRPYVAICDVMVIPSRAVETFSISALESMAMGKPMVMTNIGGASEQIIEGCNGYLIRPGDVDGLVERLARLQDGLLRREMGKCARRMVQEKYSLGVMIESFGRLFGEKASS